MSNNSKPRVPEGFTAEHYHPFRYLWVTVGTVLIADALLDLVVWRFLPSISTLDALILNVVFLLLVVIPLVYLLTYRPLSRMIEFYQRALREIRTLRGIIPICSYCKKIRDEEGGWNQLEAYIDSHSDAEFSHGVCPECYKKAMEEME